MAIFNRLNSYKEAEALRDQLAKKYKIEEPFIIAYYNGSFISIQEALELEK